MTLDVIIELQLAHDATQLNNIEEDPKMRLYLEDPKMRLYLQSFFHCLVVPLAIELAPYSVASFASEPLKEEIETLREQLWVMEDNHASLEAATEAFAIRDESLKTTLERMVTENEALGAKLKFRDIEFQRLQQELSRSNQMIQQMSGLAGGWVKLQEWVIALAWSVVDSVVPVWNKSSSITTELSQQAVENVSVEDYKGLQILSLTSVLKFPFKVYMTIQDAILYLLKSTLSGILSLCLYVNSFSIMMLAKFAFGLFLFDFVYSTRPPTQKVRRKKKDPSTSLLFRTAKSMTPPPPLSGSSFSVSSASNN